jgi:hypothetical protein
MAAAEVSSEGSRRHRSTRDGNAGRCLSQGRARSEPSSKCKDGSAVTAPRAQSACSILESLVAGFLQIARCCVLGTDHRPGARRPASFLGRLVNERFSCLGHLGCLKRRKIDTSQDRRDLKASPSVAYRSDSRSGGHRGGVAFAKCGSFEFGESSVAPTGSM